MKSLFKILSVLLTIVFFGCISQKSSSVNSKVVYKSHDLIIKKLSASVYQHISYIDTETFGRVPCNGMIVKDGDETVIFDTPTNDKSSGELIKWINNNLNAKINAVIATHFHNDCVGGLKEFTKSGIPCYATYKTIALAKENKFNVPDHGFDNSLTLNVGKQKVYATFFGEGHTRDNVVGYFPGENVMFGGCLIKEVDASKGYLEDSNVKAWVGTVEKVKNTYPNAKIVIPGHGEVGGQELLDYTIKLFKTE
ncbi:subclass B1 metallo-beta-lactamase [Chryseobacterium paridis]|uniref:beta-lactamase n=1 Tax=Chryseobacterium paridis TaxID=2800328 RepID=A0ABS1FZW9_9FLAO|nr:subclass B1 metallo-beta-lactamase [Chryseobacterium paridis]MBK1897739.1 subclass B1 metallo-beta-lactamase [Chryseobacterium paridis]